MPSFSGSAILDFLIVVVCMYFVGYLAFCIVDFIAPDDRYKEIGKYMVIFTGIFATMLSTYLYGAE